MFRRKHHSQDNKEHDTANLEEKVKELRAALGSLSGHRARFCDDACLRRYLVARNWNVDKSKKMLEETLKWRSTYKPENICWEEVAGESETGKMYRAKFHDRDGRTVIVMTPGKQNTSSHDTQLKHLVYLLENAVLNLPKDQEQMIWLIDFTGWSLRNSVPIKTARETANVLQNHYPERLCNAFLYNPPRIFETFWKVVQYFLDPVTFQKVKFVYPKNEQSMELMHQHFDLDILPEEFGGRNKIVYDHEEFTRMMIEEDIKTLGFWGLDDTSSFPNPILNGNSKSEVVPE